MENPPWENKIVSQGENGWEEVDFALEEEKKRSDSTPRVINYVCRGETVTRRRAGVSVMS